MADDDDALKQLKEAQEQIVWRMTECDMDFDSAFLEAEENVFLPSEPNPLSRRIPTPLAGEMMPMRQVLLENAIAWKLDPNKLAAMSDDEVWAFGVPFFTGGRFTAAEADALAEALVARSRREVERTTDAPEPTRSRAIRWWRKWLRRAR